MTDEIAGFKCPKCLGKLSVIDSRGANFMGHPTVRRRRICLGCDHRFTTFEISQQTADEASLILASAKRANRILSDGLRDRE